jgi:hypothetical protein
MTMSTPRVAQANTKNPTIMAPMLFICEQETQRMWSVIHQFYSIVGLKECCWPAPLTEMVIMSTRS